MEKNYFEYSAKQINKKIEELNLHKATMRGVHDDLQYLKKEIEKLYADRVFYFTMWVGECGFHGWDWSKDDGQMADMKTVTDEITDKFKEIYALILAGLGEKVKENDT